MDIDSPPTGTAPVAPVLMLSLESSLPPDPSGDDLPAASPPRTPDTVYSSFPPNSAPATPSSTDRTTPDFVVTLDDTPTATPPPTRDRPRVRPPSPTEPAGQQKIEVVTGVTGPAPPPIAKPFSLHSLIRSRRARLLASAPRLSSRVRICSSGRVQRLSTIGRGTGWKKKDYCDLAASFRLPCRCLLFACSPAHALHNNTFRQVIAGGEADRSHDKVNEMVLRTFFSAYQVAN
uniref:Uncharacterized protein n=1 Tax=Globodera pallida TaxID=36090 RepID=A0A183BP05_GLOPA